MIEYPDHGAPHQGQPTIHLGQPLAEASGVLVLIHGRGATAESMVPLAEELADDGMATLLPQAAGNVWYPQRFLAPIEDNEPFLSSALQRIDDVVRSAIDAGVPADRIIVGGFSQGACLAAEYVARTPQRYGGVLVFSGGVIGPPEMEFSYRGDLAGTPALVGCSDSDFHIPQERVHATSTVLANLGAQVTERIYPGMGHTINEDEVSLAGEIVRAAIVG